MFCSNITPSNVSISNLFSANFLWFMLLSDDIYLLMMNCSQMFYGTDHFGTNNSKFILENSASDVQMSSMKEKRKIQSVNVQINSITKITLIHSVLELKFPSIFLQSIMSG